MEPMSHEQPTMFVIAGPSGSGKSRHFPVRRIGVSHFNVDDRCAELNHGSHRKIPPQIRAQAQRECQDFIEACTQERRSFAVETTLRTDIAIEQARRARAAGFRLVMVFIATDNIEENVLRVARRGLRGGHSAPASRIREIYQLSLANLPGALLTFHEILLYDSGSFDQPPRRVAKVVNRQLVSRDEPLPTWCVAALRQASLME